MDLLRVRWSVERSTRVLVSRDLAGLGRACGGRIFLVADAGMMRHHSEALLEAMEGRLLGVFAMEAEERLKTPRTLGALWSELQRAGFLRGDTLAAAGGGIVMDTAAFAASTWMRGTRLVLVPSTLLGQVDACLGGKTAVNLRGARNQAGTFHPAELVWLCEGLLSTLPEREVRSGAGEVLKTALLAGDETLRRLVEGIPPPGAARTAWFREAASRCLACKAGIVEADPEERGDRALLNLGHTLGHALEGATRFALSHGEAVGLGTLAAARMAAHFGARAGLEAEVRGAIERLGLPVRAEIGPGPVLRFLERDKKTRPAGRRWVMPLEWGDCRLFEIDGALERRLVGEALEVLA